MLALNAILGSHTPVINPLVCAESDLLWGKITQAKDKQISLNVDPFHYLWKLHENLAILIYIALLLTLQNTFRPLWYVGRLGSGRWDRLVGRWIV